MIKFFRRIRRKLIDESNLKRYLIYAIGEILLVMVGILLALQVNNWNENSNNSKKEEVFLQGIKADMTADLNAIEEVAKSLRTRLSTYKSLDPDFTLDASMAALNPDFKTFGVYEIFGHPGGFSAKADTYHSMIASGQSNLIKEVVLLQKIQSVYLKLESLDGILSIVRERADKISWKYAYEKKYWTIENLQELSDKKVFADLTYLYDAIRLYLWYMEGIIDNMLEVVKEMEE